MLHYHCIRNTETLAKMDGLSEKDAPSLISLALPLTRKQGLKTSLHGSTPETLCQRGVGPERKGGEKDSCSLQILLLQYPSPLAREAG